ncbi:MAG TPA: ABC transporter substrate-binding protein [Gemmatimonadales bacterium]|nr:ABC transporter substrate-binding protein [Gemmatimonadales bacterium]
MTSSGCWLLALTVLTAACGGDRAARRGSTVLFAYGADLETMNSLVTRSPLPRQVERYALLTTLARYDSALQPRPYLARLWIWSPDRRTLTVALHTDVHWSDGVPTTAEDVVWTLHAARDSVTGYPRYADLVDMQSVTALNDSTVVLRWSRTLEGFPDVLTDLAILPAHLLRSVPDGEMRSAPWNTHPIGNGPFRFVSFEHNRRWIFEANPDFPASLGGPPMLSRFLVVTVDEPTAKLAALVGGELDFAGITAMHVPFVRRDPRLAVLEYPLIFPYGLVLNTRRPPFDDPTIRLALALAIDRRAIIDGVLFGFGRVAEGPVPPELPGYVPVPPVPFAPDSARRLLAGHCPSFDIITVGSGEAAVEQLIQANLAAVGCQVGIRQYELATFNGMVYRRHDFDAAVMGLPGDPGLSYVRTIGDLTGLPLPEDPGEAQSILGATHPVIWLYHGRGVNGMNRRVRGVRMDARGELPTLASWSIAP